MQRFRGGLVFKAHRLSSHSTLGLRVIKKKKISAGALAEVCVILAHRPPMNGLSAPGQHIAHSDRIQRPGLSKRGIGTRLSPSRSCADCEAGPPSRISETRIPPFPSSSRKSPRPPITSPRPPAIFRENPEFFLESFLRGPQRGPNRGCTPMSHFHAVSGGRLSLWFENEPPLNENGPELSSIWDFERVLPVKQKSSVFSENAAEKNGRPVVFARHRSTVHHAEPSSAAVPPLSAQHSHSAFPLPPIRSMHGIPRFSRRAPPALSSRGSPPRLARNGRSHEEYPFPVLSHSDFPRRCLSRNHDATPPVSPQARGLPLGAGHARAARH